LAKIARADLEIIVPTKIGKNNIKEAAAEHCSPQQPCEIKNARKFFLIVSRGV